MWEFQLKEREKKLLTSRNIDEKEVSKCEYYHTIVKPNKGSGH